MAAIVKALDFRWSRVVAGHAPRELVATRSQRSGASPPRARGSRRQRGCRPPIKIVHRGAGCTARTAPANGALFARPIATRYALRSRPPRKTLASMPRRLKRVMERFYRTPALLLSLASLFWAGNTIAG